MYLSVLHRIHLADTDHAQVASYDNLWVFMIC